MTEYRIYFFRANQSTEKLDKVPYEKVIGLLETSLEKCDKIIVQKLRNTITQTNKKFNS